MQLVACWVAFPLVLGILALGCGSLLRRASGDVLPPVLVLPSGLALLVILADVPTRTTGTAKLALPLVLLAGIGGLAFVPRRRPQVPWWTVASVLGVFLAWGAPVLLTGKATFAGYISLDDTATWLAFSDRVLDHGRSVAGLAPSSYRAALAAYFGSHYPMGAFLPLGIGHKLTGQDTAWLFQPYLTCWGAVLALALHAVLPARLGRPWQRAGLVFVAAQPALLYAYAQWGSVKEMVSAALVVTAAATVAAAAERSAGPRGYLPAAVTVAAIVCALSMGGGVWLAGPIVLVAFVLAQAVRRMPVRRGVIVVAGVAVTAGLAIVAAGGGFLSKNLDALRGDSDPGNLLRPLRALQVMGIWPAGDFRTSPHALTITHLLLAVAAVAIACGLVALWQLRARALALYALSAVVGVVAVAAVANQWVTGKAMATCAPAFVAVALFGALALTARGRRIEGGALAGVITFGVLWSNVLAFHHANLAPHDQLAELETIGHRLRGQGPTLMTEFQPYGARHFLREADGESASELRFRRVPLRTGAILDKGQYADLDRFDLTAILEYRSLVLRRSPAESRPPAGYRRIWSGRWYEVWQRGAQVPPIAAHLPLGDDVRAGAPPDCAAVRAAARAAGVTRVVAPVRQTPVFPPLAGGARAVPRGWQVDPAANRYVAQPVGNGTLTVPVTVDASGVYDVWIGGSVRGTLTAAIDGARAGAVTRQLQYAGQYLPLGHATLRTGAHVLSLRYSTDTLSPGSGGDTSGLGPLVLVRRPDPVRVDGRGAAAASDLCAGVRDWVETLR